MKKGISQNVVMECLNDRPISYSAGTGKNHIQHLDRKLTTIFFCGCAAHRSRSLQFPGL